MSYLSKKGYVLKKEAFTDQQLFDIKSELRGRPLVDPKFNLNKDTTFSVYIETKNKLYIPKMYGIEKFGMPDRILDNYNGKSFVNEIEFTGTLRQEQLEPCNLLLNACKNKGGGILSLNTGGGKCHKKDTPILMFDGSIKMVQDIKEGELLMGDDSTPRQVLSLARGRDTMYDIIPTKGEKYTVNQEHILCLKISGKPSIKKCNQKYFKDWQIKWFENNKYNTQSFKKKEDALIFLKNVNQQEIMEISVKDYLKLSNCKKHILKGYKVSVDFQEKQLPIDPYMIGFWLGDGSSYGSIITSQDSTILYYFIQNLPKYNLSLNYISKYDYGISGYTGKVGSNIFLSTLKNLDLINNKHIPMIYKCNSRENRLKLLAGLLDSDGSLQDGGFDFIQKSEKLIDDVIYLCRSLGFSCYKSKQKKGCWYKGEYKEDVYYRISINGKGIEEIPTLCPRKQAKPRQQIKDVLVNGITVKYVGEDNYYGFTLDGNCRYLLGDFTVTHNTFSALYVASQLKGKCLIVVNKIPLMEQWKNEIKTFLPNANVGIIQGSKNIDDTSQCDFVLTMIQSLSRVDYPGTLFDDFSTVIFDESHNYSSQVFSKVLFKLCCKYTIGLSATPNRSDGCEYIFKWHIGNVVYQSNNSARKGLPPIIRTIKIDSVDYREISVNRYGQKQIQFTSMLSDLVMMPKRNKLITTLIKDLVSQGRKILVLSDRRAHLVEFKKLLDNDNTVNFTSGLFLGSMKQSELDRSTASQVILASFAAFKEGVSVKELDTLILTTPKKFIGHIKSSVKNDSGSLDQIIGRIFRKEHIERNPLVIDIFDNFSVYKSQSAGRKVFYKQAFKTGIFEEQSIKLDNYCLNEIVMSCVETKELSSKKEKNNQTLTEDLENKIEECIIEECILEE